VQVVREQRRDHSQPVARARKAGLDVALDGVRHHVALAERERAAPLLQQVEIFNRRLGRLHDDLDARNAPLPDARKRDPERVVHAAGVAGEHDDFGLRLRGERTGHQ